MRGEVWDKAGTSCRQAGTKARARSANRAAAVCCEQALATLEHFPHSRATLDQAIDLRLDLQCRTVLCRLPTSTNTPPKISRSHKTENPAPFKTGQK